MILNQLASIPPSDVSGSTAANRFEFQISWALKRILELHQTGKEYALILDFHDDVLELDDEELPTCIDFYQIKTKKNGNWTQNSLCKRKKLKEGKGPSILGKLFNHYIDFSDRVRKTGFVSNQPIKLDLLSSHKSIDLETFVLSDVTASVKSSVKTMMEDECDAVFVDKIFTQVEFLKTDLSLANHVNQCCGSLTEFLSKHIEPEPPTSPVYKLIRSELKRRNNLESAIINEQELKKKKLFGRSHLTEILNYAKTNQRSIVDLISLIRESLLAEKFTFSRRQNLLANCKLVLTERLDPTNELLLQMISHIKIKYQEWLQDVGEHGMLSDCLVAIEEVVDKEIFNNIVSSYSKSFFEALILVINHEHTELSSFTSQSSDETS